MHLKLKHNENQLLLGFFIKDKLNRGLLTQNIDFVFLTCRYFRLLFQEAYIDFDKKVGSGLILLTVAFCLAFKNIYLKFDGIFTSFRIK